VNPVNRILIYIASLISRHIRTRLQPFLCFLYLLLTYSRPVYRLAFRNDNFKSSLVNRNRCFPCVLEITHLRLELLGPKFQVKGKWVGQTSFQTCALDLAHLK
jgi:hypothetical protein